MPLPAPAQLLLPAHRTPPVPVLHVFLGRPQPVLSLGFCSFSSEPPPAPVNLPPLHTHIPEQSPPPLGSSHPTLSEAAPSLLAGGSAAPQCALASDYPGVCVQLFAACLSAPSYFQVYCVWKSDRETESSPICWFISKWFPLQRPEASSRSPKVAGAQALKPPSAAFPGT